MKKYLALLLAALMLIAAFAGCGEKETQEEPEGPAVEAHGVFHTYFSTPPATLNYFTDTNTPCGELCAWTSGSLFSDRATPDGKSWEWWCEFAEDFPQKMDEEGKVWRVTFKDGIVWENGDTLDANDLVYTFKMLADPKQVNVSSTTVTASVSWDIVNLAAYSKGECSWEDVGIKLIDDKTVEFTGTYAVPQINVMRYTGLRPVYQPLYDAGLSEDGTVTDYGTEVSKYMSCGPFKLTEWVPDAKFTLVKNENYAYADKIKFLGVEYKVVPNAETALQLFMNGELDYCNLAYSDWEQFEDDPRVYEYFNDSLMYMFVNLGNPNFNNILGNLNFRKALYYGADRVELASTMGVYTAVRYVRKSVIGSNITNTPFVDYPVDYLPDATTVFNPELANEYLTKAYEENKIEHADVQLLQSETATFTKAVNEMLQKQYDKDFNGKLGVTIRQVPSTISLRRWNPDDPTSYDISIGSLLPLATDPRASFRFFTSSYNPPRVKWDNKEFDDLYDKSMLLDLYDEEEAEEIVKLCQQMEKVMLDDLVIIPLYEKQDKVLYATNIHLPVENYVVGYGFGEEYMTID